MHSTLYNCMWQSKPVKPTCALCAYVFVKKFDAILCIYSMFQKILIKKSDFPYFFLIHTKFVMPYKQVLQGEKM